MRWYSTVLLRQPARALTGESPGQSVVWAFLDTEEVRGSNPLAPTRSLSATGVLAGMLDFPASLTRPRSTPTRMVLMTMFAGRPDLFPKGSGLITALSSRRAGFHRGRTQRR
jgi:hypothetical protein